METVEISAYIRPGRGKGSNRRLRRQGRVPGTFYGPTQSAISIEVDTKELVTRVANLEGSHLIRLQSDVQELSGRVVLLRELQCHPVSGAVLHADLYEVDLKKKLTIKVPIHFIGKAIGVAQQGGILQPLQREVAVECLPTDIPEYLELDVSNLSIHDTIHVAELQAPPRVTIQFENNDAIVTVMPPTVEQVKAEAEGEAPVEPAAADAAAKAAPAPAKS